MNTILETAFYWKKAGISTIPIKFQDKHPDSRLLPKDENGKPVWEPYQKRLPTDDELNHWFPGGLHNIGLVTGWSNVVVLDFDDLGTYLKWSIWTTRKGGYTRRAAEMAYSVQTSRGIHVYFRTKEPEQNRKLDGIDVKARNGYVLIPPSIHPSGAAYKVKTKGYPVSIEALSDILPAQYLVQNTEYQGTVVPPISSIPISNDPWDAIMQAPDPTKDLISQIRQKYRIEDFFPQAVETGGNGRWKMDCCPFHDDKHPSFWIDTNRQICACYGGCTPKPLDVVNLYARLHGLTNRDAIFYLAHL